MSVVHFPGNENIVSWDKMTMDSDRQRCSFHQGDDLWGEFHLLHAMPYRCCAALRNLCLCRLIPGGHDMQANGVPLKRAYEAAIPAMRSHRG